MWNETVIASLITFVLGVGVNHIYVLKKDKKDKRTARIAHLTDINDKFYVPLQEALKGANPDAFKFNIIALQKLSFDSEYQIHFNNYVHTFAGNFVKNYDLCMKFSHFAPDEIVQHLKEFNSILYRMLMPYALPLLRDEEVTVPDYYHNAYKALNEETEQNITILKKELVELVNQ